MHSTTALKNQSGLTLIEILIGAAIAMGLALGIAEFMVYVKREEARTKVKQEAFNYDQSRKYQQKIAVPPSPGP